MSERSEERFNEDAVYEGGCLCGQVRWRGRGAATHEAYCHCRSCRLSAGAPFVAWATFATDRFEITTGSLTEYRSSKAVVRGFCGKCGTTVSYIHDKRPEQTDVTLATLDDPSQLGPKRHIWMADKLPWVKLGDDLPCHDRWGSS